jgi:hypothetical protein
MMRGQDSRIRIEGSATPKLLAAVFSLVLLGVAATSAGQVANLNGVRYASAFAGTDGGEKLSACMADLPAGGGVCDLRGLEGAQTVSSTVSLNKPLRLDFGASTFTCRVSPCFNITSPDLAVSGIPGQTKLVSATGGTLFAIDDSLQRTWKTGSMRFKDMDWQGGPGDSQAIYFPTQSVTERQIVFDGLIVHGFGSAAGALRFGESVYYIDINRCTFYANTLSVRVGLYDEFRLQFSEFYWPKGGPQVRVVGNGHAWIEDNEFMFGSHGTGTASDIYIEAVDTTGTGGSYIRISDNKFGNDVAESSSRYKIEVNGAANHYVASGPIWITGNDFGGASGDQQKAIHLAVATGEMRIEDNYFSNFGTIVDDTFSAATAGSAFYGKGVFRGNHIWGAETPWTLFTNGGRGFETIEPPAEILSSPDSSLVRVKKETPKLNNRFAYSEAFDSWTKSGIRVTSGQTDPWGGTNARLLTRVGSSATEYVNRAVDTTRIGTTLFFRIWLKAGTLSNANIILYDATDSKVVGRQRKLSLGTDWAEYKTAWNGIEAGKIYSVWIYPGGQVPRAGTIYAYAAQASDYDSDYYPTSAGIVSATKFGTRFANGVIASRALAAGVNLVESSTTPTFDASMGNTQRITLADDVTSSTLTNAAVGQTLNFLICQDGAGSHTFVWPTNVKGGMTISAGSSTCNAQTFIFDGANAYALSAGVAGQ